MKIYRAKNPNGKVTVMNLEVEFVNGEAEVEDSIGKLLVCLRGYSASENQSEKSGEVSPKPVPENHEFIPENRQEEEEQSDETEYSKMSTDELKKIAKAKGVYKSGMNKQEIIVALS